MEYEYSFCENVHAVGLALWHIRKLTENGRKFGGGADTLSLCGRKVDWDLRIELTDFHLSNNACKRCLEEFRRLSSASYIIST